MATRRVKKSRKSSKAEPAAATVKRLAPGTVQLRKVIEQLIDAKQRGDFAATDEAAGALTVFNERPASTNVRLAAAEARAVAGHPDLRHSIQLLKAVMLRLPGQSR